MVRKTILEEDPFFRPEEKEAKEEKNGSNRCGHRNPVTCSRAIFLDGPGKYKNGIRILRE